MAAFVLNEIGSCKQFGVISSTKPLGRRKKYGGKFFAFPFIGGMGGTLFSLFPSVAACRSVNARASGY